MNRLKKWTLYGVLASVGFVSTGCMGSFGLTLGLYDWNRNVGDKYVSNAIFWLLNIIPVYGVAVAADFFIFNFIEFWSGSNPIAMAEGEVETQTLAKNGAEIKMTATKNQFTIENLTTGETKTLVYTENNQSWNLQEGDALTQIIQILDEGEKVKLFHAGQSYIFDNTNLAFQQLQHGHSLAYQD